MADLAPTPQQQPQAASAGINQMVQAMMQRMMQSKLPGPPGGGGQGATGPVPQGQGVGQGAPVQGRQGPGGGKAAQFEMGQKVAGDIMKGVQNAVQQHKQKQLNEATGMWMTLQAAHDRLTMTNQVNPDGTVDLMKDPMAAAILTDPKKMKNMAKAFQVDMMNPEKTNVYAEGLKKAMKLDKSGKMIKMLKGLVGKGVKPQMGPEQNQQMGSEIGKKVEGMVSPNSGGNQAQMAEMMRIAEEDKRTEIMGREKYDFKQGVNPTTGKPEWMAFDKTNPSQPGKPMQIEGQDIGAPPKATASIGKPVLVEGKPVAIVGESGAKYPGDKDWTDDDTKHYAAANKGWADAEAAKQKLAGIRASTYIQSREYGVYDTKTGKLAMLNPAQINKDPERYTPAAGGAAAITKEAVFGDLYYNADNVEEAAKNLKHGFDNKDRALAIMALRSNDPTNSVSTYLSSVAQGHLKPDQIDYITALASLQENAMAMRSVAGLGAGSDMLREQISRTVPSAGTPNLPYVQRQLKLFRGTAQRLEKGVPLVATPDRPSLSTPPAPQPGQPDRQLKW